MEIDERSDIPVHTPSKIRFKEDEVLPSHHVECVLTDSENCAVDLGLLSERHHYEVWFFMAHTLGNNVNIPNIKSPAAVSVTGVKQIEGRKGHKITLEVRCGNPGHLVKDLEFTNSANEKVTLTVSAKIMANRLGTPALKSGVKILHRCSEDSLDHTADSNAADTS